VMAKVADIRRTVRTAAHPHLRDLVDRRFGLLPIVWIGIGLSVFQQLVGINVIFYYSTVLWASVGFSQQSSLLITVITSVVNIATTFIAIGLVEHDSIRSRRRDMGYRCEAGPADHELGLDP